MNKKDLMAVIELGNASYKNGMAEYEEQLMVAVEMTRVEFRDEQTDVDTIMDYLLMKLTKRLTKNDSPTTVDTIYAPGTK